MSTVDPIQAALGGDPPEPSGAGDGGNAPEGAAQGQAHPILDRFGGDVSKLADAYAQLDSEYGRQGSRLGKQVADLETQLVELQTGLQQQQEAGAAQNGAQEPDLSIDQLEQWMVENPAQATAYLIAQGQQMQVAQFEDMLNKRLGPLEVNVGRTTASTLVEGLSKTLGADVVSRNADVLVELRKTDPAFFQGDPQVVFQRMKTAVIAAEAERQPRGASNGAAAANVAVEGGSGGRNLQQSTPASEAEEFLQAMATTVKKDIFGNPVRS